MYSHKMGLCFVNLNKPDRKACKENIQPANELWEKRNLYIATN